MTDRPGACTGPPAEPASVTPGPLPFELRADGRRGRAGLWTRFSSARTPRSASPPLPCGRCACGVKAHRRQRRGLEPAPGLELHDHHRRLGPRGPRRRQPRGELGRVLQRLLPPRVRARRARRPRGGPGARRRPPRRHARAGRRARRPVRLRPPLDPARPRGLPRHGRRPRAAADRGGPPPLARRALAEVGDRRLPRAADAGRELRPRHQPLQLTRLPRRRRGHPRPGASSGGCCGRRAGS